MFIGDSYHVFLNALLVFFPFCCLVPVLQIGVTDLPKDSSCPTETCAWEEEWHGREGWLALQLATFSLLQVGLRQLDMSLLCQLWGLYGRSRTISTCAKT